MARQTKKPEQEPQRTFNDSFNGSFNNSFNHPTLIFGIDLAFHKSGISTIFINQNNFTFSINLYKIDTKHVLEVLNINKTKTYYEDFWNYLLNIILKYQNKDLVCIFNFEFSPFHSKFIGSVNMNLYAYGFFHYLKNQLEHLKNIQKDAIKDFQFNFYNNMQWQKIIREFLIKQQPALSKKEIKNYVPKGLKAKERINFYLEELQKIAKEKGQEINLYPFFYHIKLDDFSQDERDSIGILLAYLLTYLIPS